VFDLTRRKTFENTKKWMDEFYEHSFEKSQILLVGNKFDIVTMDESLRAVKREEAERFSSSRGINYIETSAVTDYNVQEAFVDLLQEIYYQVNARDPITLNDQGFKLNSSTQKTKTEESSCC